MMAEVWPIFWSWSLVTIVKLKFGEFFEVKIWSRLWGRSLVWNIVGKFWSRFWNWNLVEILKLNFDQILITLTLLKALNPRVYFACGNVLCNAQNCVVIPSIIALSRHFAHMKKENLVLGASGWCHLWWATPKNPLHGGWLGVGAGLTPSLPQRPLSAFLPWAADSAQSHPPSPLGLFKFSHTPNFAPNFSISQLLTCWTIPPSTNIHHYMSGRNASAGAALSIESSRIFLSHRVNTTCDEVRLQL